MAFNGFRNPFLIHEYRNELPTDVNTEPASLIGNSLDSNDSLILDAGSGATSYAGGDVASSFSRPAPAPATDWSSVASAGVGAAGSTIGTLAQLIGQQAAFARTAESNELGRVTSEKLAKMRLAANDRMAANERRASGQQYLLGALQGKAANALDSVDTQRMATRGLSNLLARAFMAGK